jgi:O-antigen ligase
MQNIIVYTLYLLSILIPLTFTTVNSELFEFPKFILLLSGTLIIIVAWCIHMFQTHDYKLYLRPSIIHYSVFIILITHSLATIFSIHPYTSFWGYYSRFHGGLLTTICYTIIYFTATKWLDKKSTLKLVKISIITAFIISLYAIAERLGIDKNFWIQDVQNRPFSTLGQPNWLAAYIIPNIFLALYLTQTKKFSSILSSLVYLTLLVALIFTRSRSGFIGFSLSYLTYWLLLLRQFNFAKIKQSFILATSIYLLTSILAGTPYSPPLSSIIIHRPSTIAILPSGTQLENGGTESGDIRKIVWSGALSLIQKYPLLGTGPETFAYTYYWTRPTTHNMTSEWDFLYNKAHNEYLNIAACSGLLGLLAYLYFHYSVFATSLTLIPKSKKVKHEADDQLRHLYPVLGASITAFFITNFFGFSVIPVYLLMIFLSTMPSTVNKEPTSTNPFDIRYSLFFILVLVYPLRLFLADIYYIRGKAQNQIPLLQKAIAIRPGLDLFHAQLGETYAATGHSELAIHEAELNKSLNPYHLNFYKSRAKIYLTLSMNVEAAKELVKARALAPTDPKLAYNLGLVYTRLNDPVKAEAQLQDTIALKPDYAEPYYALTLLYEQIHQEKLIPDLLHNATTHLATYSSQLKDKIEKYGK